MAQPADEAGAVHGHLVDRAVEVARRAAILVCAGVARQAACTRGMKRSSSVSSSASDVRSKWSKREASNGPEFSSASPELQRSSSTSPPAGVVSSRFYRGIESVRVRVPVVDRPSQLEFGAMPGQPEVQALKVGHRRHPSTIQVGGGIRGRGHRIQRSRTIWPSK